MVIFAEVTVNKRIIDRRACVIYIHFLTLTRLKVSLYALGSIDIGLSALWL